VATCAHDVNVRPWISLSFQAGPGKADAPPDERYRRKRQPAGDRQLQVYQGATLLYRRVIDSAKSSRFEVRLRPKPA